MIFSSEYSLFPAEIHLFGESKGHRFSGVATDLILFHGEALGRESLLECILIKAENPGFLDKSFFFLFSPHYDYVLQQLTGFLPNQELQYFSSDGIISAHFS